MTRPGAEQLVLAIDGGGSKTDVLLVTADGRRVAHVRGPASSPHLLGLDGALDLLEGLVLAAATGAGAATRRPLAAVAQVSLAGLDLPVEEEAARQAVARRGWAQEHVVGNDTFALLRAGTDAPDAVAVVCGAGINCVGTARDGRQARFAALGRISGDWGGGTGLGEEALWWAARAADGRGPATTLTALVPACFGLPDVPAVYEALHLGRLSATRLMDLAPLVLAASRDGDGVARGLVRTLAEEVVHLARVALTRLDLLPLPSVVVLGGGVLTSGDDVLLAEIEARLAAVAPLARTVVTEVSPVVGAALLGLDRLGAPPEAERALRVALAELAPVH